MYTVSGRSDYCCWRINNNRWLYRCVCVCSLPSSSYLSNLNETCAHSLCHTDYTDRIKQSLYYGDCSTLTDYCPSGQELNDTGVCVACLKGFHKNNSISIDVATGKCQECPPETTTPTTGTTGVGGCNISSYLHIMLLDSSFRLDNIFSCTVRVGPTFNNIFFLSLVWSWKRRCWR